MNNIIISNNHAGSGNNTGNTTNDDDNDEDILKQIKDDDYYMERKYIITQTGHTMINYLEPPRFHYYQHIRVLRYGIDSAYLYTTQDELDFILKRELKISPEQRYQDKKANFLFHDLSCYMNHINDYDYNDDGSLKGCTGEGCVPECQYYPEYGRIEDEQVIQEHKEYERYYRNKNQIINIDIDEKDFRKFLKENPDVLYIPPC